MKRNKFLLLFILLLPTLLFAQGSISGKVTDAKTNETLIGVVVVLENTTLGGTTDMDGNYKIADVPVGSYTIHIKYIGYETKIVNDFVVMNGETKVLNVAIGAEVIKIKEATVIGAKIRNTENAVIAEMKNATAIVSGTSSAQIQKSQDRNAADVVKRIPGVTIVQGRFINIRGLNERYNNVWLNDANAPSTEADKRAFSFDVIPAGMIERIMIYKTPSPELPGDFVGGMVKIYTQSIPENNIFSVGYSSCIRQGSTFNQMYYTQVSKTDKYGYDNGFRSIPSITPNYLSKNDSCITDITKAFKNTWRINNRKADPDNRANLSFQRVIRIKGLTIGNTTGLSYSTTNTTNVNKRADYDSTSQNSSPLDTVTTSQVNVGLMENIGFRFNRTTIEFKNLFNQTGTQQTTMRNDTFNGVTQKFFEEYYQARTTYLSQLIGTHKFNHDLSAYDWNISYNYGNRNEPDFKRIKFVMNPVDSTFKTPIANVVDPINGGGRFFTTLKEHAYSFNHNFKEHIIINKYEFDVAVGNYVESKSREFSARILGYTIKPGYNAFILTKLPLDSLFDTANVGDKNNFKLDEITSKSDTYKAQNLQEAGYITFTFPFGERARLAGGIRYEYNKQSLQSSVNQDSISPSIVTKFYLPSANLSVNLTKKMLMRFAYGKTLNRPEFREWSPFYFYDFQMNAGNYGSLFPTVYFPQGTVLKVAQIQNVDVRYEWYPAYGDMIHVGGFYKYFKDPIQQVITPTGGSDSKAFTFINGDHATLYGAEIDMRKGLGFIGKGNSTFWNSFALVCNATLLKSELTLPELPQIITKTQLQGQSPYVVNAGIYFQNDSIGFQSSLLYNVVGPRIYAIGNVGYGSIGEMAKNTLDFTVTKRFFKRLYFTFAVQDILNEATILMLDIDRNNKFETKGMDKPIMSFKSGRYYTFGLKVQI